MERCSMTNQSTSSDPWWNVEYDYPLGKGKGHGLTSLPAKDADEAREKVIKRRKNLNLIEKSITVKKVRK